MPRQTTAVVKFVGENADFVRAGAENARIIQQNARETQKLQRDLADLRRGTGGTVRTFGQLSAAFIAAGVAAGVTATTSFVDWGQQLQQVAFDSGFTIEQLQLIEIAGERVGIQFDQSADIILDFVERLGDARTGTATYVEVFDRLGVSYARNREEGEIFLGFVDALAKRTNEAERLFDIREISGEGSPLFQAFADGDFIAAIQDAREEVNILSDDPNTPNTCLLYTSPSPRDS